MIQPQDITDYYINTVPTGGTAIDATAGNGFDTLKLCRKVGENGKVYAFDIQKTALEETKKKLCSEGFSNARLIHDSHARLDEYITEPADCAVFNLGYLPGGDHSLQTKTDTTIEAIKKSLTLLKSTGFVSVTVYYGKNSGTEEKEGVMEFLKCLDHKKYTVLTHDFHNRPNNPPITVIITKNDTPIA